MTSRNAVLSTLASVSITLLLAAMTATPAAAATVVVRQTTSQAITDLNSVSCNNGVGHTDNRYSRIFDLDALGFGAIEVDSVTFGVQSASSGSGSQTVTVRLYTSSMNPHTMQSLTQVATADVVVADGSGTTVTAPVTASVPAGSDLVAELFTPNGEAAGNLLFVGSNTAAETGASYLVAADCGITQPTTTTALGFPDMHIILEVNAHDANAPTVTVEQAAGQADPTSDSPLAFTATFSEAMTGFDATDVDLSASTATGTLQAVVTGSGPYTVTVSGMTGTGSVTASIPAAAATAGGLDSLASTSTDNSVTFDPAATVTLEQAGGQPDPTSNNPVTFTATFSEAVTGFDDSDIDLSASTAGGALSASVTGAGPYTVEVTGITGSGDVVASIPAAAADDLGGNPSLASTSNDSDVAFVHQTTSSPSTPQGVQAPDENPSTTTLDHPDDPRDNTARSITWSQFASPGAGAFAQAGRIVLLGRDDLFADSLASGGAQGVLDAPLLLTPRDALDPMVSAELERLGATDVVLLGGHAALDEQVEADLAASGYRTSRLAGPDRVSTAVAVARAVAPSTEDVLIARAFADESAGPTQGFADALAAGAWAAQLRAPLLLTSTAALSGPVAAYLVEAGVRRASVVGGEAAVGAVVIQDLQDLGITVTRAAGDTRFATATAIAAGRGAVTAADATATILVDGTHLEAWADAFAGALYAGRSLTPVLLADGDTLPGPTLQYLSGGGTPLVCGTATPTSACEAAQAALAT